MKSRDSLACLVCLRAQYRRDCNNPDYSRLIYCVTFPILTQYRFHSDLEPRGRRRPFRTFALRPPPPPPRLHCSIMQRRLNRVAVFCVPDFKGDTFPDGRWSWRPPIMPVSKAWRVTYRARNRKRYARMRQGSDRRVVPCCGRCGRRKGETGTLGHTRGSPLITSVRLGETAGLLPAIPFRDLRHESAAKIAS